MHYICTYCGNVFKHKGSLQRHIRMHTGERPHWCADCGKSFIRADELIIHTRTHTGERPFVCEVCGKSFSIKDTLNVHKRIHTKEKSYRCSQSSYGFKHSGNLTRHINNHTEERPHRCAECGKSFIQSVQLSVHMRTHTEEKPSVCTLCNEELASNEQLKIHLRSHIGKRQFACDSCGKTFAHNHVLKLHKLAHLGERLYKCNLCADTFSSKKAFNEHIKLHGVLPIRQSILSQQDSGETVVSSSQPTSSKINNPCKNDNGMGSVKAAERLNPSPQQSPQGSLRSLSVEQLRSKSNFLPYSLNSPRDTIGGIHRQRLLASLLFESSAPSVNQANTDRAKEQLSSDYQKNQEQKQLIIIKGKSKVHHQHDPDSTNFRHIPPLIPITPHYTASHCLSSDKQFDQIGTC